MRYFAELRYNGAAYCGWQRQPDAPTVQGTVERALSTLLRAQTEIVGAGRTDTGVNASYYVAHFDCERPIADAEHLVYKLNLILPPDIAVGRIAAVADDAHARFSACEREYRYYIERRKNPFTRHAAWQYYVPLDVDAMNRAAALLPTFDDFTSFAKLNSNNTTNICRIAEAAWLESGDVVRFTIRADRFLRNMVRAIVGTLVDVGRGRYSVDEFGDIISSRDLSRSSAGAPAQGLFLSDVRYPAEVFGRRMPADDAMTETLFASGRVVTEPGGSGR
ncbi:MAG: tRNA pseudouridine(38-40) synthase TruA [Alistipes sp.]|nr:tRNA pseudouridine(38-40) synthase TruA [Alistipes sp.]